MPKGMPVLAARINAKLPENQKKILQILATVIETILKSIAISDKK
jgi:hypothetical protein